jgi:hypothetical protein
MSEDLAVIEPEDAHPPAQALTLFGTADPVAVVDKASAVATALARVIDKQGLFTVIGTKKHVHVEGWTLLGSMLGVFAHIEWTRKTEDGWEARAVAVAAATGAIVGAGEAECLKSEPKWKGRDDFALRGMAQTRALSRALRGPLGFVAVLAGYAATPFEEMPQTADEAFVARETARRSQGAGAVPPAPPSQANSGAPPPTPQESLERIRAQAKPAATDYDDTTAVCPRCGKAEFLRPVTNPKFCQKAAGGCGAPAKGDAWTLISYGEFKERHK